MISFKLNLSKLTADPIHAAVKKSNKRFVMQAGGYVRTTIRRSMRFRKGASPAGTPPSAHRRDEKHPRGPLLREFVRFAYDPLRESVVVGPQKLSGARANTPARQEFGYTTTVRVFKKKTTGRVATPAQKDAFLRKVKRGEITKATPTVTTISVPARPSARPGLQVNLPKFPTLYARYFGPQGGVAAVANS